MFNEHKWFYIRKFSAVFFAISAVILASYSLSFTNVAVIDNFQHQFDEINGYITNWLENYHEESKKFSITFGNLETLKSANSE